MKWNLLKTPVFITALLLLLLNDFVLKSSFSNVITGKLSDFAGVFIFAVFWLAIFPKAKKQVILLVGLFFIWWKSPLSEGFIHYWNSLGIIEYARVIDYWDLMALSMLPLAYKYASKYDGQDAQFNTLAFSSLLVSCFAFFATSKASEYVDANETYVVNLPKDTVVNKLYHLDDLVFYSNFNNSLEVDTANGYAVNIYTGDSLSLYMDAEGNYHEPFMSDTLNCTIASNYCNNSFETRFGIRPSSDSTTIVHVFFFEYFCDKIEGDKETLKAIFENKVISKLE
ncbi:MAG: hypothetical protein MK078_16130 [Crocinitomicaceae bacterium]|nr:hypothetical protein [Crocinitomicaceae bacterium]